MVEYNNYAAIDIGTNAVRLLIKSIETENGKVLKIRKLLLLRVALRLGFDVFKEKKISAVKAEKLKRLMKAYRQMMLIYDVVDSKACATSAMRDAENGKRIIKKIKKATDININIIDGAQEARIIYNNHENCQEHKKGEFIYVDVGGGSTEVNFIDNGDLIFSKSYNIGTIRILTSSVHHGEWDRMKKDLEILMKKADSINIIGSGGNINKLYKLIDNRSKSNMKITVSSLINIYNILKNLSVEQRMTKYSLRSDRADVIVPACEIFIFISQILRSEYIFVPVIGLSDGIIGNLYRENTGKNLGKKACK